MAIDFTAAAPTPEPPKPLTLLNNKLKAAESRAADEVAPAAILGRFRYTPGLGWLRWDGIRWETGPAFSFFRCSFY